MGGRREAGLWWFLVLLVLLVLPLLGSSAECNPQPSPTTTTEAPMLMQLAGYDLQTAVQAVLEEVDGQPPAPSIMEVSGAVPTSLELTPDRRGQASVLVGLSARDTGQMDTRVEIRVAGQSLVEGVMPLQALERGSLKAEPLLAPVSVPPSTPLDVVLSSLPGETSAATPTITAVFLSASERAVAEVERRFGRARWWSAYCERGGVQRAPTLNVEHGGRPSYLFEAVNSASAVTAEVTLDGRTVTRTPIQLTTDPGSFRAMLPHEVEANQIYAFTFEPVLATDRAAWAWHGPSWWGLRR